MPSDEEREELVTEAAPATDPEPVPGIPQEIPDVWYTPVMTYVPPLALALALLVGCGGTQAARADARRTACAAVESACAVAHAACSR